MTSRPMRGTQGWYWEFAGEASTKLEGAGQGSPEEVRAEVNPASCTELERA